MATPEGEVAWSEQSAGRGAWLCVDSPSCIEKAKRRKAFSRALRTEWDDRDDPMVEVAAPEDFSGQDFLDIGRRP